MAFIKKGYGFNVGYDFTRASEDMPLEIDTTGYEEAGYVFGYIKGNAQSKLTFLRPARVRVQVRKDCVVGGEG